MIECWFLANEHCLQYNLTKSLHEFASDYPFTANLLGGGFVFRIESNIQHNFTFFLSFFLYVVKYKYQNLFIGIKSIRSGSNLIDHTIIYWPLMWQFAGIIYWFTRVFELHGSIILVFAITFTHYSFSINSHKST